MPGNPTYEPDDQRLGYQRFEQRRKDYGDEPTDAFGAVGIHIGVVDARGEPEQQQREQFCGEGHDEQQDGEPPPCHVSQCYAPAVQEAGHTAGVCRA